MTMPECQTIGRRDLVQLAVTMPLADYQLPTTSYQLPAIARHYSIYNFQFSSQLQN